MKITNLYKRPVVCRLGNDEILYLDYLDTVIRSSFPYRIAKNLEEIVVGKPLFEYNPIYTVQYSTTQGLPALNIFNHYDIPILVNDRIISPKCQTRYKGIYDNGIPFGEVLTSSLDEDVIITDRATNLHYGLFYFPKDGMLNL